MFQLILPFQLELPFEPAGERGARVVGAAPASARPRRAQILGGADEPRARAARPGGQRSMGARE